MKKESLKTASSMCIKVQQRIVNYGFVFVNNYQGGGLRRTMSSKLMTDKNDDLMHKFARNKSLPGNSISRSCLNKSRVLGANIGLYKTSL